MIEQDELNHRIELLNGVGFTPKQLWFIAFAFSSYDEEMANIAVFGKNPMPDEPAETMKREYFSVMNEATAIDRLEGVYA